MSPVVLIAMLGWWRVEFSGLDLHARVLRVRVGRGLRDVVVIRRGIAGTDALLERKDTYVDRRYRFSF